MSVELLAPAGSFEGVLLNLEYGADAVYVGGSLFGARAYAKNLSQEELCTAIDEAHIRGKRLYLTVNTILKNRELYGQLFSYLAPYYEQGLDAVIVQDFGVVRFLKREFPDLPIHASTQMAVTGPEGAAFLEKQGIKRVVTARELSLEELHKIRGRSDIEIEVFVHGALCYAYSGQCLFSSMLGGRSGNRGRCAQPCRLNYQVRRGEQSFGKGREITPLSLKDMNTIELLPRILKAGVNSLKIEGRMKQSSYAAGVVNIYRKYLDLSERSPGNYQVEEADRRELVELFSRGGSCKGYYEMRGGREMLALKNDKKMGKPSRQIIKIKEKVKGNLILSPGERAILTLEYGNIRISVQGDVVQEAQKQPLDLSKVRNQIGKTGNTPYEFAEIAITSSNEVFLPVGGLNQLRRDAFSLLQQKLAERARRTLPSRTDEKQKSSAAKAQASVFTASCEAIEQARVLMTIPEIQAIYCNWDFVREVLRQRPEKEIYMVLPHVVRDGDLYHLAPLIEKATDEGCAGILVRNLESAAWLLEQGYGESCILDNNVYTYNNESVAFWRERGIPRTTASFELNYHELCECDRKDTELEIYGYIPMMISAQCVQKNLDKCRKNRALLTLKDRFSKDFPVKCYCDFCYNIIYNSLPYGLSGEWEKVKQLGFSGLRMTFTLETPGETKRIATDFIRLLQGDNHPLTDQLTKGHFKRGVE